MNSEICVGIVGTGVMGKGLHRLFKSKNVESRVISPRELLNGSFSDLADVTMFIECVKEELEIKIDVFNKLQEQSDSAILATCTSSLSVLEIQKHLLSTERFLGIHFMNPPSLINEVEIIPTSITSDKTLAESKSILELLNKRVTIVPDTAGLVVNALLFVMLNRAVKLLEETMLSPNLIDELIMGALGHNLGPLKTIDLIGIDTTLTILGNLYLRDPQNNQTPASLLIKMCEQGRLGRKVKSGFYEY
jgi:3-hydroxyacyl-CoA dehydrogenase